MIVEEKIKNFQEGQKAKIFGAYATDGSISKEVTLISKADFEKEFPVEKFEHYSLEKIHQFRTELMKSDSYSDAAFASATEGLRPFVVQNEGKQALRFVRAKSVGA